MTLDTEHQNINLRTPSCTYKRNMKFLSAENQNHYRTFWMLHWDLEYLEYDDSVHLREHNDIVFYSRWPRRRSTDEVCTCSLAAGSLLGSAVRLIRSPRMVCRWVTSPSMLISWSCTHGMQKVTFLPELEPEEPMQAQH